MPEYAHINNFPLKIIFLLHFLLTSLSTLGHWTPPAYLYYNFMLIILLLWTIHRDQSPESLLELAYCINGCAVLLDIFVLAFCFPHSHSSEDTFSAIFAIFQLIVRPFTTIYLIQLYRERTGNSGLIENMFTQSSRTQSSYEDIEGHAGSGEPTRSGYDISNAQQI